MPADLPVIVYVDDAPSAREEFAAAFGDRFDLACVASAGDALALLAARPADVLVSAEQRVDPTRPELLAAAHRLSPRTVVVALVAERSLEALFHPLTAGLAVRCVSRPADPRELTELLDWAVELASICAPGSALQRRARELERLALLGGITSSALHEVNQPLSYLTANSERLAQLAPAAPALASLVARHGPELDPASRRLLAELAEELPDIVRDMGDGCRVMRGLTSTLRGAAAPPAAAEPRRCDPRATIDYVLGVCRKLAVSARVTLSYTGPEALPPVAMSAAELSQVLIALVTNAVEAFASWSGRGRATIDVEVAVESVRIVLADDGPGMTPEVLARAGAPFFSTKPSSAGLGLAMARRLVHGAGGDIELASTPGKGTTVAVALRRADAA